MQADIKKWGDSLVLMLPMALIAEAKLRHDERVDIRYEDGELRIRPLPPKRYNLDELLASVPDDYDEGEWDTGPAVGNEVWW